MVSVVGAMNYSYNIMAAKRVERYWFWKSLLW